jgi:outer membrane protein insertion porin family
MIVASWNPIPALVSHHSTFDRSVRPLLCALGLLLSEAAVAQEVKTIRLEGVSAMPPETLLGAARGIAEGKTFDPGLRSVLAQELEKIYRQRGYTLARVTGIEVSEDGTLTVALAEGRLREVVLRGLTRTRPGVLQAVLRLKPGAIWREDIVAEDRSRLARLGIFDDIQVAARAPGTPDEDEKASRALSAPPTDELGLFDLIVRVKERSTGNVAATVGYNDGTGFVGFVDLSEANLSGSARQVSLQWQRIADATLLSDGTFLSQRPRQAFSLGLAQPALKPGSLGLQASIYNQNTVFLPFFGGVGETLRSYEKRIGGRIEGSKSLGKTLSGLITLRQDRVGYESDIPAGLLLGTSERETASALVGAWGIGLQADGRDVRDQPRRGFLHRLSLERAGGLFGGDVRFTQARLDLRQYEALGESPQSPVLAVRLLGGTSSGETPLPEQFFLGGFELLRGYELFSLRGDRMLLGSAEVRFPLGEGMSGVAFGDFGNAWRPGQALRAGNLKATLGVGLRFASPLGPIRFDLAHGDRIRTYVSLGQSF